MSAVRASSSARPRGTFRWVERCCPRTWQARRSETWNFCLACSMQRRRRAGLRSFAARTFGSRGSLSKDELLDRQVGDSLPQPLVLLLKLLQSLHLVGLQTTELLAPSVVGELRHTNRPHGFRNGPALRHQHVDLPKLHDDLFRLVLLLGHSFVLHLARKPTSGRTTFQGADQDARGGKPWDVVSPVMLGLASGRRGGQRPRAAIGDAGGQRQSSEKPDHA